MLLIQTSSHSLIESDNVQSSRLRFNIKFESQLINAFGIGRRKLANGKYSFCEYFNSKKSVKLFGANDDIILGAFLLNFKFILWSPFFSSFMRFGGRMLSAYYEPVKENLRRSPFTNKEE
jgi:hypothetical protein